MSPRGPTVSRRYGRTAGAWLAACSLLLQGCYESLPLQQGPVPVAVRVQLVLNDEGRASLAPKLGPAVEKVEGEIVSEDNGAYTMSVFRVTQMNGNTATWTGERVNVAKEHTVGYQVRRLNRTRTTVLAAAVTVATVLIFFGKSLGIGGASSSDDGEPVEPPPSRVRRP